MVSLSKEHATCKTKLSNMKVNVSLSSLPSQSSVGSPAGDADTSQSSMGSKGLPAFKVNHCRLLKAFLTKHDSKRVSEIDGLLKKHKGKEAKLMLVLAKKVSSSLHKPSRT